MTSNFERSFWVMNVHKYLCWGKAQNWASSQNWPGQNLTGPFMAGPNFGWANFFHIMAGPIMAGPNFWLGQSLAAGPVLAGPYFGWANFA